MGHEIASNAVVRIVKQNSHINRFPLIRIGSGAEQLHSGETGKILRVSAVWPMVLLAELYQGCAARDMSALQSFNEYFIVFQPDSRNEDSQ